MEFNNTLKEKEENKTPIIVKIILVLFFSLIVIVLVAIYYFVISNTVPVAIKNYFLPEDVAINNSVPTETKKIENKVVEEIVNPNTTKIIKYIFPVDSNALLNIKSVNGSCNKASVAQPFRNDAYICTDLVKNYDPCFASIAKDKVICQMDPLLPDIFIINLTKPLPNITLSSPAKDNWAWFLELEDGTQLSPYLGTRPVIDGEVAFYGSGIINSERTVLIGELSRSDVWSGKKKVLILGTDKKWTVKSTDMVRIKTVWQ